MMPSQNVSLIHDNVFKWLGGGPSLSDEAGKLHDINQAWDGITSLTLLIGISR